MTLARTNVYWGYLGIMENEMETTLLGYIGVIYSLKGFLSEVHNILKGGASLIHDPLNM